MRKENKKGIAVCLQELMQLVARKKKTASPPCWHSHAVLLYLREWPFNSVFTEGRLGGAESRSVGDSVSRLSHLKTKAAEESLE